MSRESRDDQRGRPVKQKPLVLVKIGGSLITDKNKPFSLNEGALDLVSQEIKKGLAAGKHLILGHGAGSFAHIPAKKYQTHRGIINSRSYRGIAEVADVAARLNRIVVGKLLARGVNAVSVSPLSIMVAENHRIKSLCSDSVEELLRLGILPVLYGDQILDTRMGCTIFSTEKVLGYLALHLKKAGYRVERIIHCGLTNGVYDDDGETIRLITSRTIDRYRPVLGGSGGVDVTGGMAHKVEEAIALAKRGIPGLIIDGIVNGSLSKAISGEPVMGTVVRR